MSADFTPNPEGAWAPRPKGHSHAMRPISYTLDGPLAVLLGCSFCSKTEAVKPNPRLRKIPEGFTTQSWSKFLTAGEERRKALSQENPLNA